jgi:hypothetical protein
MKYETLIEEFIKTFPEFSEIAEQERKWWEGDPGEPPLVHVFFGDILNPYLIKELSSTKNKTLLKRLFDFLELMAVCDDKQVQEVLTDTILERIGGYKEVLKKARSLMGSETLRLSHKVEKFWGRE